MDEKKLFDNRIWSDRWCIEDGHVWFMGGEMNILFQKEEDCDDVEIVSVVPCDNIFMFRQNPICIKNGDVIYSLPDNGEAVWIYHITNDYWSRILIENPKGVRLSCGKAWVVNKRIYIVSIGLRQIIEIDTENEEIVNYHNISNSNQKVSDSVLIDNYIYVIDTSLTIYKFDCVSKEIYKYELSQQDEEINRICYDGEKFWTCGYSRKIYVWNEDSKVEIIDSFPDSFGIYNFDGGYSELINYNFISSDTPLFISNVSVGEYIWFIPFKTNEILYADKKSMQIKIFHVENEMQDKENLKIQLLHHKYLLEYVKEDRYIGLYSLKNRWIIEIDSLELKYRIIKHKLNGESSKKINSLIIEKIRQNHNIIRECEYANLINFEMYIQDNNDKYEDSQHSSIGKRIYQFVNAV
jgi:hypothetical protein